MRFLHLVKHAQVVIDIGVPSRDWRLAADAADRVRGLVERIRGRRLRRIVASPEGKATETGRILADVLGLPLEIRDGLEEHHRLVEQQTGGQAEFQENVRRFFTEPGEIVFGTESADTALHRFRSAVESVMAETDDEELIVSHGTVMALLIAAAGNGAPMDIWSSLGLPHHVALGHKLINGIPRRWRF